MSFICLYKVCQENAIIHSSVYGTIQHLCLRVFTVKKKTPKKCKRNDQRFWISIFLHLLLSVSLTPDVIGQPQSQFKLR